MIVPRRSLRAFRRAPGFMVPVCLCLGAGLGLGAALAALFELQSVLPPRLASVLHADPIAATEWTTPWSHHLVTPAQNQDAGVHALVVLLAVFAVLAAVMALVNVLVLVGGRRVARRGVVAVRAALGATPGRLRRWQLREAAPLLIAGAVLGLAAGVAAGVLLRGTWPAGLLPWTGAGATARALSAVFTMGILLLAAAALPVSSAAGHALAATLRGGARTTAQRRQRGERSALAAAQIAIALSLLTGAGLLLRHARPPAEGGAPGLETHNTLTMRLRLPPVEGAPVRYASVYGALLERVRSIPTVEAESIASPGTWVGIGMQDRVLFECGGCIIGELYTEINVATVHHHAVSPGFFEALGIPLVAGRTFRDSDRLDTARVAVVNETLAHAGFRNDDPLGRRIQIGPFPGRWFTIVGVVRDVAPRGVGATAEAVPALYLPTSQQPPLAVGLAVRASGDPAAIAPAVERAVHSIEPRPVIEDVSTLEREVDRTVAPLRWFGGLFAVLAAIALVLACYGLHAVMRGLVESRRREIAIRMALGATRARTMLLVLRQATGVTIAGGLAGLLGSLIVGRALQLLFAGMPLFDATVTGRLALLLAAVALTGAALPAWRAAGTEPRSALDAE